MKYSLLFCLFAATVLVSAANGHPSRGAETFLARLNQNLNKVCAKVNSLEQEVDSLSGLEDQVAQLSGAVSDLTQLVIEQGNTIKEQNTTINEQGDTISDLEQRIEDLEGQNTTGTVSIVNEPRHEKTGFLQMRKQRRRSASR